MVLADSCASLLPVSVGVAVDAEEEFDAIVWVTVVPVID
jgi:hypothetical protein